MFDQVLGNLRRPLSFVCASAYLKGLDEIRHVILKEVTGPSKVLNLSEILAESTQLEDTACLYSHSPRCRFPHVKAFVVLVAYTKYIKLAHVVSILGY